MTTLWRLAASVLVLGLLTCPAVATTYYIDSVNGNDGNSGTSSSQPWQTIPKIQSTALSAGDGVLFARGSSYNQCYYVDYSGASGSPITIGTYGTGAAPAFTNATFVQGNFGNCIRIRSDFVTVDGLYFYSTAAVAGDPNQYSPGDGPLVWQLGAVNIESGCDNCVVQNCEFYDCVAAIRTRGQFTVAQYNNIHDCSRVMVPFSGNWGPLGIWMGNDHQTANNNIIRNMISSAGTANIKGGAFEVDDNRISKYDIKLSRNFTQNNCGFLECVFDVPSDTTSPAYDGWVITFNVSDDYQAFTKLRYSKNCAVNNNTILSRKVDNGGEQAVFVVRGHDKQNRFKNNLIMTKNNKKVFDTAGDVPADIIQTNHYYAVGTLVMGDEGPGTSPTYGDAKFADISATTAAGYKILSTSPCKNTGQSLNYTSDFEFYPIPYGSAPDRGAFEYHP
jgi:hypothetical protein